MYFVTGILSDTTTVYILFLKFKLEFLSSGSQRSTLISAHNQGLLPEKGERCTNDNSENVSYLNL